MPRLFVLLTLVATARYFGHANARVKSGQRVLAFLAKADRFPAHFKAN